MNPGVFVVLGLVGFVIIIIVWYYVAEEFYTIATKKGYPDKKYLWWTFFFGIAGMLMVVALPLTDATKQEENNTASATQPIPENTEEKNDFAAESVAEETAQEISAEN